MNHSFGRLLSDYERIATDEATAIREWNFAALASIHANKTLILQELARIDRASEAAAHNPEFKARLNALRSVDLQNLRLLDQEMMKVKHQFRLLASASQRLRLIGNVYTPTDRREAAEAAFFAQV
jgi:hypothetical protein